MSAPLIWIVFPILMGSFLLLIQRWRVWTSIVGVLTTTLLVIVTRFLPIGETLFVGPYSLQIGEQFQIAGGQFIISAVDRPWLILLSLALFFIQCGSLLAQVQDRFIPLSLILLGFLYGALTITPFIYAVIFIEISSLVGIFIISTDKTPINTGLVRFLIFQTLGLAFLLFSGPLNLDASGEASTVLFTALMFAVGFAILFSIFPLYSWIPLVMDNSHPYGAVAFISIHYGVVTLFFLRLFQQNLWILTALDFFGGLLFGGVLLIATAGAWAAFQRHLGRILGYAVVIEIGYSLLSIGLRNGSLHYALVLPRMIGLLVWGLALTHLKSKVPDLRYRTVQGLGRQYPIMSGAILFANFSLAGLPLLASFPIMLSVWRELTLISNNLAIWAFLGSFGLLVGGLRTMAVLVMGPDDMSGTESEQFLPSLVFILGVLALFFVGLFPHWFWPLFIELAEGLDFLFLK
jgi:NADH-quinone oxidoreductase subunit N